ncbi:uncharacterized protein F58A4.6 [Halictus rubicundus]|uniref:uncharacterized protein F58A4.6 n=1 Tax=Halictus rubicundus TaxID=77578 RepID=UPI0040351945
MNNPIKLIIHKGSTIFDSVIITSNAVIRYEQKVKENRDTDHICTNIDKYNGHKIVKINVVCLNKKGYSAYLVSAYIATLINSQTYHTAAYKKLLKWSQHRVLDETNSIIILMKIRTPKKQFLDYKWNSNIIQMILERREVDHAMSWLSTLGGAFSALGDEYQHCAEMAGKISVKQLQLAMRLGDPHLVARCKLYAALSLIQQGQIKIPKTVIRNIYKFAFNQNDVRLQNMCLGIWAKLKYCYKMKINRTDYFNIRSIHHHNT